MVEQLLATGVLHSEPIQAALLAVPRHRFIAGADVDRSYADVAVAVKITDEGTALSAASQPTMVAAMLEMVDARAGDRVLEIGTGTGYNAALLAQLVGQNGMVVTIELEDDLAAAARDRLDHLGFEPVTVVIGDGAEGDNSLAPFDRIIVTTGAPDIAPAWLRQLRPGGRLVVPVVGSDGIGMVRCLVNVDGALEEVATLACGFLPMRFPDRGRTG